MSKIKVKDSVLNKILNTQEVKKIYKGEILIDKNNTLILKDGCSRATFNEIAELWDGDVIISSKI